MSSPVEVICSQLRASTAATTKVQELLSSLVYLCADDCSHAMELWRKDGLQVLDGVLTAHLTPETQDFAIASTCMRVLAAACQYEPFVEAAANLSSQEDTGEMESSFLTTTGKLRYAVFSKFFSHRDINISHAAIHLVLEVLKASANLENDSTSDCKVAYSSCLKECDIRLIIKNSLEAFRSSSPETFLLMADLLSALLSDSPDYVHAEPEKDVRHESLAERKSRIGSAQRRKQRSQLHGQIALSEGMLLALIQRLDSENPQIRQRAAICLNRLSSAIHDDETFKRALSPYLVRLDKEISGLVEYPDLSSAEGATIRIHPMEVCRIRASIETALFLSGDCSLGDWSLLQPEEGLSEEKSEAVQGLSEGIRQLLLLVASGDERCQQVAVELMSGAVSSEKSAALLSPMVASGALHSLLNSTNANVRASAAASLTKLSLKAKALAEDSPELTSILNTVMHVLKEASSKETKSTPKSDLDNYQKSLDVVSKGEEMASLERSVEVLAALVGRTAVKEEIVYGSSRVAAILPVLLSLPVDSHSTLAFGISHVLAAITVSNHELRAKALAEKDITPEQYNQLQELQRLKTKDESGNEVKEKIEADDPDTPVLVQQRIRRIVSQGGVSFLVKALTPPKGSSSSQSSLASQQAKENFARALKQICVDEKSRGLVIAQGGLKLSINFAQDKNETKAVRREFAHAIAKLLVTTNPTVLSEHTRLGCISPLLFLCHDTDSSNLQQFESLLALTNLTSVGSVEQDKFCSEKGISTVHYLMFSDHPMVQRAATETLCNLSTHSELLKLLAKKDSIRLWLGLAEDWAKDFKTDGVEEDLSSASSATCESYLTARAAAGTLAGASGDEEVCKAMLREGCGGTFASLLSSEQTELIHRVLVAMLNVIGMGGEEAGKQLFEAGVVPLIGPLLSNTVPVIAELARDVGVALAEVMRKHC